MVQDFVIPRTRIGTSLSEYRKEWKGMTEERAAWILTLILHPYNAGTTSW